MSKSFLCVYCSTGEHCGELVLLRLYYFLNFQVQLGDQFTVGNLFVEFRLDSVCSRKKIVVSQMYLLFALPP